jgi:hypothetical protein
MPDGYKRSLRNWIAGGWNSLAADPEYGGQGLPTMLAMAAIRDVEFRLDGLRPRLDADHGRHRGDRGACRPTI